MYVSVIYRHETHLCSILIYYTMHVFARKQCILCSALRRKRYLTLPYVTSLRDSFCLGTFAHGFIMLPPRSLASSLGCSLAIILRDHTSRSYFGDCTYIRTRVNFVVRNGLTCRLFLEWNAPRSQFTTCPRKCYGVSLRFNEITDLPPTSFSDQLATTYFRSNVYNITPSSQSDFYHSQQ